MGDGAAPITVLVVDDHRALAEGLALAINQEPDLHCIGVAHTGADALDRVTAGQPDVVLLDIGLPDIDGMEVTARSRTLSPGSRILLLTGMTTPEALARAAEAGADGFLAKEEPMTTVLSAIRDPTEVMLADQRILAVIAQRRLGSPPPSQALPVLTEREEEVLRLLADGVSVKAIARRLDITLNTCRGYVQQILRKLDTHSQLGAVVKAASMGLLDGGGRDRVSG